MLTIAQDSTIPNPRLGWATLTSFALQAAALTVVFLLPLLQPGMLSRLDLTPRLVPLFLPRLVTPILRQPSFGRSVVMSNASALVAPREVPDHTDRSPDTKPVGDAEPLCLRCLPETGQPSTLPVGTDIGMTVVPPPMLKTVAKPLRISRMMDAQLVHRVQPDYPIFAKQTHVQGVVEIAAVISKEGTIENLQILRGPPQLIRAALDAVKQWRYRPYVLNGDPIEVETRITVNFSLAGN
jgi:protein TonB